MALHIPRVLRPLKVKTLEDGDLLIESHHADPQTKDMVIIDCYAGDVSDGYHTFNELYDHRCVLFLALCKVLPSYAWKSRVHSDGTFFDDMFIMGLEVPSIGQITYHIPNSYWELAEDLKITTLKLAPPWDGHTSPVVLNRLISLTKALPSRITGLLRG